MVRKLKEGVLAALRQTCFSHPLPHFTPLTLKGGSHLRNLVSPSPPGLSLVPLSQSSESHYAPCRIKRATILTKKCKLYSNHSALIALINPSQQSYGVGTVMHLRKVAFTPRSILLNSFNIPSACDRHQRQLHRHTPRLPGKAYCLQIRPLYSYHTEHSWQV